MEEIPLKWAFHTEKTWEQPKAYFIRLFTRSTGNMLSRSASKLSFSVAVSFIPFIYIWFLLVCSMLMPMQSSICWGNWIRCIMDALSMVQLIAGFHPFAFVWSLVSNEIERSYEWAIEPTNPWEMDFNCPFNKYFSPIDFKTIHSYLQTHPLCFSFVHSSTGPGSIKDDFLQIK